MRCDKFTTLIIEFQLMCDDALIFFYRTFFNAYALTIQLPIIVTCSVNAIKRCLMVSELDSTIVMPRVRLLAIPLSGNGKGADLCLIAIRTMQYTHGQSVSGRQGLGLAFGTVATTLTADCGYIASFSQQSDTDLTSPR